MCYKDVTSVLDMSTHGLVQTHQRNYLWDLQQTIDLIPFLRPCHYSVICLLFGQVPDWDLWPLDVVRMQFHWTGTQSHLWWAMVILFGWESKSKAFYYQCSDNTLPGALSIALHLDHALSTPVSFHVSLSTHRPRFIQIFFTVPSYY